MGGGREAHASSARLLNWRSFFLNWGGGGRGCTRSTGASNFAAAAANCDAARASPGLPSLPMLLSLPVSTSLLSELPPPSLPPPASPSISARCDMQRRLPVTGVCTLRLAFHTNSTVARAHIRLQQHGPPQPLRCCSRAGAAAATTRTAPPPPHTQNQNRNKTLICGPFGLLFYLDTACFSLVCQRHQVSHYYTDVQRLL